MEYKAPGDWREKKQASLCRSRMESSSYKELLFDRSRGSDDDDDFSGDFGLEEMEGVEKIEERKRNAMATTATLPTQILNLLKLLIPKVMPRWNVAVQLTTKYAKIPSSEGSEDDEGEDAVDEGNPFKTMPTMHFGNDPSTPYLYKGKYTLTFQEKMHILLLDVDSTKICTKRPNGVHENSFFVIDRAQLKNASDWLMTDVGAFDHRGKAEQPQLREGEYLIRNLFFRHKNYNDFLRTATTLVDCHGDELQLGLIEYRYTGEEHHVSPHKNLRTGKTFVQTAPSTRDELKFKVKGHQGPSSIFDEAVEKAGGIFGCEVMADMPRDVKQIKNARQSLNDNESKSEFARLLGLAKDTPSVKNLQWTPNPRVVFCTDEQLHEIVKECCSAKSQSILAIDTTYNVGDFYVTSTTYQSGKFIHSRTGKPAILPGPVMFHIRRSEKDFKYFIYTLLEQNDQLETHRFRWW
ncbi:hypothetical protein OS493_002013 [Desmophyllum pertusum]|uniref:Uncharacterized protein n=1 Tax=Desmophyllum pertusum TaxID=174260 RepID=A0A9X0CTR9_9CNID|nr:hypothetical protein OS493_002013 [Desmophyllum pertusum]